MSYKILNDWDKELRDSAEKEHLQTTIFQDLKTTRTRHSARALQILQARNKHTLNACI